MRTRFIGPLLLALVASATVASAGHATDYSQVNRNVYWLDHSTYSDGVIYKMTGSSASPCETGWTACDPANGDTVLVNNVLDSCANVAAGVPCIEGVWLKADDTAGEYVAGVNTGEMIPRNSRYAFDARPAKNVGRVHVSNLYTFGTFDHGRGQGIEVNPTLTLTISPSRVTLMSLTTLSRPVYQDGDFVFGQCFYEYADVLPCWKDNVDAKPYTLKISLRLPQSPSGMATGRLQNANYLVESVSDANTALPVRMTFEGMPVLTPGFERNYWYNNLDDRAMWNRLTAVWPESPWNISGLGIVSAGPVVLPTDIDKFKQAVAIDPTFDTADKLDVVWRTDVSFGTSQVLACPATSLVGYVGSNSLTYASAVPSLDPTTGYLTYRVASPHFAKTGQVFHGVYEMVLDQNFAQCIWNSTNAGHSLTFNPGTSTMEVVAADGTVSTVGTSVFADAGLLHFTAQDFTFSEKRLRVKLTKTAKYTLNCIKGSKLKSVTGTAPKCPSGYKVAKKIVCIKSAKSRTVIGLAPKCPSGWRKKA